MFFSSLSSSFSPVSLLRIAFRTPSSLVGCSDFSSSSVGVFSLLLALPFLSFIFLICLSFFRSFCFRLPAFYFCLSVVLFYRTVCRYMRLSFFFLSPFGSLALASELHCLPCDSFATFDFSLGFLSFPSFRLRFFQITIVFPCWYVHISFGCFSLTLGDTFFFLFFSFMFIGIASAVFSLALFILAPWVV